MYFQRSFTVEMMRFFKKAIKPDTLPAVNVFQRITVIIRLCLFEH